MLAEFDTLALKFLSCCDCCDDDDLSFLELLKLAHAIRFLEFPSTAYSWLAPSLLADCLAYSQLFLFSFRPPNMILVLLDDLSGLLDIRVIQNSSTSKLVLKEHLRSWVGNYTVDLGAHSFLGFSMLELCTALHSGESNILTSKH